MTPANGTSADISRKAWLLAQHIGYTTKSEFARAMGWDPSRFSRTLSGDRQWTLDDLHTLADALELEGPGDLFRPLADLITDLDRRLPTGSHTCQYSQPSDPDAELYALITDPHSPYQPVTIPDQRAASVTRSAPIRAGEDADAA